MKKRADNEENRIIRSRLYTSVLLVLLALAAITAATVAWFSIADRTKVRTMSLDIAADVDMRMDLDAHEKFKDYVKKISFESIAARMQRDKGFSMQATPLEPVTTIDYSTFTYENGTVVPDTKGAYLTFTLHFMAEKDMIVHLNSADSSADSADGTRISSGNASLPESMRIAFTADGQTWIYDQGMGDTRSVANNAITFGLPPAGSMQLNKNNAMFSLKKEVDKPVLVHIWMEGTDPACTDSIKAADYAIRMRFTGEATEKKTSSKSGKKVSK